MPIINIMLIGNKSVGKTTFLTQIIKNKFIEEYRETIEFNLTKYSIKIDDEIYNINFYDASGNHECEKILNPIYNKMDIIIVMYDIYDCESMYNIYYWCEIAQIYNKKAKFYVIGNKRNLLYKEQNNKKLN
jgi:small GTP-binding protein